MDPVQVVVHGMGVSVMYIPPINYFPNLQFFKENGSQQTCYIVQGTQITVESVFISRFTMNNFAPKLQKCWRRKIVFKILSKC